MTTERMETTHDIIVKKFIAGSFSHSLCSLVKYYQNSKPKEQVKAKMCYLKLKP